MGQSNKTFYEAKRSTLKLIRAIESEYASPNYQLVIDVATARVIMNCVYSLISNNCVVFSDQFIRDLLEEESEQNRLMGSVRAYEALCETLDDICVNLPLSNDRSVDVACAAFAMNRDAESTQFGDPDGEVPLCRAILYYDQECHYLGGCQYPTSRVSRNDFGHYTRHYLYVQDDVELCVTVVPNNMHCIWKYDDGTEFIEQF